MDNQTQEIILQAKLQICDEETKKYMESYFVKSKEAEESLEGIDALIPYNDFINKSEEYKKNVLYWIGWDSYGYDEIKNRFGGGNIDKGIKRILKTNSLDYQIDNKTYRLTYNN